MPSLAKAANRYHSSNNSNAEGAAAVGVVEFVLHLLLKPQAKMLGSQLPVANQQLKARTSKLSHRRIHGAVVAMENDTAFISVNEAANWLRFNPYSPMLTGEFLKLN